MKRFVGKNIHRLSQNPVEEKISELWSNENERWYKNGRGSILQYTLSPDGGKTLPDVSERDEMIAATVIQWLGTPIGQSLFNEMFSLNESIIKGR